MAELTDDTLDLFIIGGGINGTTRQNLEEIADFLGNSGADLIALQEADAPSRWSGKFNHVDFLSEKSHYACRIHARHAQNYMYDFGTALLSRVPYTRILVPI